MPAMRMAAGQEGVGKGTAASSEANCTVSVKGFQWDCVLKRFIGGPLDGVAAETSEEADRLVAKYYNIER